MDDVGKGNLGNPRESQSVRPRNAHSEFRIVTIPFVCGVCVGGGGVLY